MEFEEEYAWSSLDAANNGCFNSNNADNNNADNAGNADSANIVGIVSINLASAKRQFSTPMSRPK